MCRNLQADNAALRQSITQVRSMCGKEAGRLEESRQAELWMNAWRAKKELQLQLYERGEAGIREELTLMERVLADSNEELHDLNQEILLLQQGLMNKGITLGGGFEHAYVLEQVERPDYLSTLAALEGELAAQRRVHAQLDADLRAVHDEKDFLMTRIEVLEQVSSPSSCCYHSSSAASSVVS